MNNYEEIVKDVERGENLSAHMFTVIYKQNRLSALADLHWQNMDDNAYKRVALIAHKYYKLKQAISIALQEKRQLMHNPKKSIKNYELEAG